MFELSKQFRFESAHTLHRRTLHRQGLDQGLNGDADSAATREASRRIHGHSYRAEVVVRGDADPDTGMVVDFGRLERAIEAARLGLDHHFLDEVSDLGPATMENLSVWIWRKVSDCAGLVRVTVYRDSTGETCSYFGPRD